MTKFSEKITGKIKKEKLSPKPKILFLLKNITFWGLYIFAAIIGALTFSVILLALFETDFEATRKLLHSPLDFVRTALPLTWILLFSLLFALAYFGARHTKKGYRFSPFFVAGINIGISIFLGLGLYISGFAHAAERTIAKNIPVYKMLEERREQLWDNPENGLLSGEIEEKWNGEFFVLLDASEKKWNIVIGKNAQPIPPPLQILLGKIAEETTESQEEKRQEMHSKKEEERIKVMGIQISENEFEAEMILPWKRHRLLPEEVKQYQEKNSFSPEQREKMKGRLEEGKEKRKEMREEGKMPPPPPRLEREE